MSEPNDKVEDFISRLRDRFVAGGLDPDLDAPLRIQISTRVPYREGENSVNKLTDADMAIIEAALDSDATSPLGQSSKVDKAINIDFGSERVFRYKDGVEIDTFKPIVVEPELIFKQVESDTEELPEAMSDELLLVDIDQFHIDAVEAATDKALTDLGLTRADAIAPNDEEPYIDPEIVAVGVEAEAEAEAAVNYAAIDFEPPNEAAAPAPDFNAIDALIDEKVAEVEAILPKPPADSQVKYFINAQPQSSESVEPSSASMPDKLPAAAIAWAQLADKLPEGSKEWLKQANDQFASVADSAFGRTVQEQGAAAAKSAWAQVTSLGEQAKNRAIADSIVALTKEFGSSQEQDGQKRWVYQAETFKVEVKGTDAYSVSDHEGNKLLSFKADRWRGPQQIESNLQPMQAFDIVQAGTELSAVKAWEATQQAVSKTKDTAQSLIDRAQQLSERLGNLAPQETREQLVEGLDRQAASLAQTLVSSKEAVQTAAGSFFDGKPFAAFKSAATEAVGMFREGVEGAVLKQDAEGNVRSRFGLPDLKLLNQFQQQVQQRVEQSIGVVAAVGKSRDRDR